MRKIYQKIIFLTTLLIWICSLGFCMETQLYRNKEYHFSINIPAHLSCTTPRNPNIIMSAENQEMNVNINIKKSPVYNANQEIMEATLEEIKNNFNNEIKGIFIKGDIYDFIPNHKCIITTIRMTRKYPTFTTNIYTYQMFLIMNGSFIVITYGINPKDINKYENLILYSFSSFVDETGWY